MLGEGKGKKICNWLINLPARNFFVIGKGENTRGGWCHSFFITASFDRREMAGARALMKPSDLNRTSGKEKKKKGSVHLAPTRKIVGLEEGKKKRSVVHPSALLSLLIKLW